MVTPAQTCHLYRMQSIEVKSLGYKLNASVPASTDEFDTLAKEIGASLREANRNVLYRSVLAEFRNTFLHGNDAGVEGLDKLTGIERETKVVKPEVKDADGKVTQEETTAWAETEDEYATRVFATLVKNGSFSSPEAAQASFAQHAQTCMDSIAFDPSKTERKSAGPKKVPQTYVDVANEIVKATGSIEAAVAAFARKTGITVAADVAALAAAVWADQKAQRAKIAAGYATS